MYAAMLFVIIRFIHLVCKAISMDQSKVKQWFFSKVIMKDKLFIGAWYACRTHCDSLCPSEP